MSVRIEGDLDFQKWYWEEYGDVQPVISDEIYHEYLEYKSVEHGEWSFYIFLLLYIVVVVIILCCDFVILKRWMLI